MRKKILTALILLNASLLIAQTDTTQNVSKLSELSLEELMNISIYSISKAEESSFDAPLSSSVVTRTEIKNAGCTSIMEALRLVPGVIVREQSNGNYDIHIRGLDNVPPNLGMYFFTNSTTLVMIDNRPVYNYLHGGTFWETLPVDLNDVEKIEVVRGPSSALYGPNAESGVINIITRNPEKTGWYVIANAQYGRYGTGIVNTSFGYKFNDKISAHISGNFQNRERTQRNYLDTRNDKFVPLDSLIPDDSTRNIRYPHPYLAMRKYGLNAFFNYRINEKVSIAIQGGGQHSEVQNLFASTNFSTATSTSYYANLHAGIYGLNLQVSYLSGIQSPQTGVIQWKWNYNTTDVVLDYHITKVRHLLITPGISYRRASYDDRNYIRENIKEGFFNAKINTHAIAAFLRIDYKAFRDKLRLVGAGRISKFYPAPSQVYFSWELAATYKPSHNHILRIVESRAQRTPLLIDHFLDVEGNVPIPTVGPGYFQLLGNRELKLLTTDMIEIGYRGKIKENLEIDLEIFGSRTKNFSNIVFESFRFDSSASRTNVVVQFQNLPVYATQIGGTLSFNFVSGKFQFKPFVTVQQTTIFDYSQYAVSPTSDSSIYTSNPAVNNINSGIGTKMKHLATPAVFGGAYLNCQITPQLNVNLNPYIMSGHTQLEGSNLSVNNGKTGVEHITAKFIMNVVISYTFFKRLCVFTNFKNCFTDKTREFYRGDIPGFKVTGGVSFEM